LPANNKCSCGLSVTSSSTVRYAKQLFWCFWIIFLQNLIIFIKILIIVSTTTKAKDSLAQLLMPRTHYSIPTSFRIFLINKFFRSIIFNYWWLAVDIIKHWFFYVFYSTAIILMSWKGVPLFALEINTCRDWNLLISTKISILNNNTEE